MAVNPITWLENHDKLAGWAQFLGVILALLLTYFTAFAPAWRRKRQLSQAASRLLQHGYEALESFHRVSANYLPLPISIRQAAVSAATVLAELKRFPVFELDDQGSNSVARRMMAMTAILASIQVFLEDLATDLNGEQMSVEMRDELRSFLGQQVENARKLMVGERVERQEWPGTNEMPPTRMQP